MNLNIHLKIVGGLTLLLALMSIFVPRRFGWKEDLARVSLLNRQIFEVHGFFITLLLSLFGILSLVYTSALLQPTQLARIVLSGLTIFWAARLYIQFFVYKVSLWKGNRFNTLVHILFSFMWVYYVAVYGGTLWQQYHY